MVRTRDSIGAGVAALAEREPAFARVVEKYGVPEPRNGEPGAYTLLRTIVGQQVSVAAARSMWAKLEAQFGSPPDIKAILDASDEELRAAGLSRQKAGYASPAWCWRASSTWPRCRRMTRKRSAC
jgi:DNA-3-methyladenine glycosylase II